MLEMMSVHDDTEAEAQLSGGLMGERERVGRVAGRGICSIDMTSCCEDSPVLPRIIKLQILTRVCSH